jgi:hypothetical protein
MKKRSRTFGAMTAAELARATREFDRSFAFERARPMRKSELAEERKLRRGRGRPKVGKGGEKDQHLP